MEKVWKRMMSAVVVGSMMMSTVGCSSGQQEVNAHTDDTEVTTIKLGLSPYAHSTAIMHTLKYIGEQRGYNIELVEGDVGFVYLGTAQGDIDVNADAWLPVLHASYMEKYQDDLEVLGVMAEKVELGIAVPSYAPFDTLAEMGDYIDTFGGEIVGIEPSAGMMERTEMTLEAYGYQDDIELLQGSTPAMFAELDNAVRNEEVIVFLAWRPHTMFAKYDIKILEDEKGIWAPDDIKIVANKDFKEKAPEMYSFFQKFKMSADDIEGILFAVENGEGDYDALAKEWVEANQEVIDSYFE